MMFPKAKKASFELLLLAALFLWGCVGAFGVRAAATSLSGEEIATQEPAAAQELDADGAVHVSNVDDFLAAIAPDTEIVLEPGNYNLSEARNYGRGGGEWYHWESVYDGYELVITDLSGLTIRGANPFLVTVSAEPRYANVLRFDNVRNLCLSDLTIGHTVETGGCIGGVLLFENSQDLEIQSARLYGCGVRGIDLYRCRNVHIDCSDIYECTEGCVYMEGSYNVLFENSKFYFCDLWNGVFDIYSSSEVAVINSEVFGNTGIYPDCGCLVSSSSQKVFFGGVDVHDNQFAQMFSVSDNPVTVEKCKFDRQSTSFASGLYPVSPDGNELNAGDLANMSLRTVKWEGPAPVEEIKPERSEDGKVHVHNVDEFLAAIERDTTIYLEPGVYDLSTASNYGSFGSDYYRWEMTYDGPELVISGVTNLTIEGAGKDQVTITAKPRYANVMHFEGVTNLILRNFTAGHSDGAGECAGGVIQLTYVMCANIEGCSLYGCGILGVWGMDSRFLSLTGTEIYDCSSGAAWFYDCSDVNIDYCNFHDNGGAVEIYADFYCSNILVNGTPVEQF